MEAKVQKWGNSVGIRIPSSILKSLNIKTNDILNIEQEEDKIVIRIPKKKKISLEERFNNYHGENLSKDFSWDDPMGEEIYSKTRRCCFFRILRRGTNKQELGQPKPLS